MSSVRAPRYSLRYFRIFLAYTLLCLQARAHDGTSGFDVDLPACGMSCARAAAVPSNCTNVGCLCGDFSFIESFFECVAETCSEANIVKVNGTIGALCEPVLSASSTRNTAVIVTFATFSGSRTSAELSVSAFAPTATILHSETSTEISIITLINTTSGVSTPQQISSNGGSVSLTAASSQPISAAVGRHTRSERLAVGLLLWAFVVCIWL
ncbi:hypothetical protein HYPSUDRAFT_587482 [Hypholoma sublateritium FD-334 SS-4]|uniref:CFEM domain-containing protein n=1 Tax=Hypholoma sublateritium (strain FD-334 SS-4) TaxID=945553 RepID=A0A0D2P428_HYPSF|nr:hypothetical protein HYPSUDRAFT_587482 [Hypholoma sublateritium FD-334 SS-4]